MITLKATQLVTGATAIACMGWGFGTGWFILGMFALLTHLVLDGLIWKLREDPTEFEHWHMTGPGSYLQPRSFAEEWDSAAVAMEPELPYKPPVWGTPHDDR